MARENATFIKTEAAKLGLDNVVMVRDNVFDFLTVCHEKFDIIFADPPYAMEGLETLPDKIFERNILYDGNYFVLEHGDEHSFTSHPYFKKEKRYGRVHFSFFVK
jgi:16S rRNA G966 N2-methylase RsmD